MTGPNPRSQRPRDTQLEAAALLHVLMIHPRRLTVAELVCDLCTTDGGEGEREAITRAIRELSVVGLLEQRGNVIVPRPAAIRSYELWSS